MFAACGSKLLKSKARRWAWTGLLVMELGQLLSERYDPCGCDIEPLPEWKIIITKAGFVMLCIGVALLIIAPWFSGNTKWKLLVSLFLWFIALLGTQYLTFWMYVVFFGK